MKHNYLLVLTVLSLLCFAVMSANAQGDLATRGIIRGAVTDPNGAAVPNATVTITGTNGDRVVTTNEEGVYEANNLIPGVYSVRIEQTGFSAVNATNQTVFVGRATTVNAKLEVGAAGAVVDVTTTN